LSETQLALTLGRLAADHSDIASAFDHLTLAIRNSHDAGSTSIPVANSAHRPAARQSASVDTGNIPVNDTLIESH